MMNVGDPASAFALSAIPNNGVGLAREEFIFTNFVKIHPLVLVNYKDQHSETKAKIDALTVGYKDKAQYCVDKLAEGIAFITAALVDEELFFLALEDSFVFFNFYQESVDGEVLKAAVFGESESNFTNAAVVAALFALNLSYVVENLNNLSGSR
jgi:hypothetical protein